MTLKNCVLACIGTLLIQNISSQCIGAYNGFADGVLYGPGPLAWEGVTPLRTAYTSPLVPEWALNPAALAASNGAGLTVTSASPIAPTGIAMSSENAYEGVLAVTGALPFLAAVSLEGVLPTAGVGAVTYSCGNGNVAILNEEIAPPAYVVGPAGPIAFNGPAAPLGARMVY